MEWLTGVVMEKTSQHVILMTPRGEFKRVRITGRMPDIGEEVRIPVVHRRFFTMPKASWLAVAAAVILFLIASPLLTVINQPAEVAVAYVAIDINPSIELTVSNRSNVMDAHAYNRDGQKILDSIEWKGMKVNRVVASVTEKAVKLGFINENNDNKVLISVSSLPDTQIDEKSLERTLLASANDVLTVREIKGDIQTIHVPSDIRENAKKKGLSPGKYAVLIEAVHAGLPVTEEDLKEKSIVVAISSAGGLPDQIIDQASKEDHFEVKEKKYLAIAGRPAGGENTAAPDEQMTVSEPPDKPGDEPDKIQYVQPIRKDAGPEDRPTSAGNNGNKRKPAITGSPVNPAGGTGQTGSGVNPDSNNPGSGNTGRSDTGGSDTGGSDTGGTGEENTGDNYMGEENSPDRSGNVNEDMYILKPNF